MNGVEVDDHVMAMLKDMNMGHLPYLIKKNN